MNVDEANAALGAVANAKRSVATACVAPLWRHAAFGLVLALAILAAAIDERLRWAPFAASVAGSSLLFVWDRKQTGMFVNGYRVGRTLPLTIALLISMAGLAFLAIRLNSIGEPSLALLTAPAAFVIAFAASLLWERIFLAEMGIGR